MPSATHAASRRPTAPPSLTTLGRKAFGLRSSVACHISPITTAGLRCEAEHPAGTCIAAARAFSWSGLFIHIVQLQFEQYTPDAKHSQYLRVTRACGAHSLQLQGFHVRAP